MLSQLDFKIFGLETIKDQYVHDPEFKDVLQNCREGRTWNKFVLNDGFVFRSNKLCIPASSIRLLLLQEAHGGGLMGHFGVKKTEDVIEAKVSRCFDEMVEIDYGGDDFHDPTTNVRRRCTLAIAKPT